MIGSRIFAVSGPKRGQQLSAARAGLLAASAAVSLSGCGAYLHDAGLKTSTAGLKTSFEGLKAPEVFAELEQRQQAFATEEDRAVALESVTARNSSLLGVIRTPSIPASLPDSGRRTAMDSFSEEVRDELHRIYGGTQIAELDETTINRLFNAPDLEIRAARRRSDLQPNLPEEVAGFLDEQKRYNDQLQPGQPKDQRKTDCKSVLERPRPGMATVLDQAYLIVWNTCQALEQVNVAGPGTGRGLLASASSDSELGQIQAELTALNSAKSRAEEQKRQLAASIKAIDDKSRKQGSSLADLNGDIQRFNEILRRADPYAKEAGLESLSALIEDLLAAELKPEGTSIPSDTTIRGAAALQMLRAAAEAKDTFSGQPRVARTNELLLAAARARHDLRMVQVEIARDEALRRNYEAQAVALLTKAAHLARTYVILRETPLMTAGDFATARNSRRPAVKAAAGEAMASYLAAWNYGEIPRRVLSFRNIQIRRASSLEAAKLTEEDYRTTLKPVFDELAAYGEGGIKPESLVDLLGHFGVAGALLGD